MKHTAKSILAALLAVVMLLGLLPTAFAADEKSAAPQTQELTLVKADTAPASAAFIGAADEEEEITDKVDLNEIVRVSIFIDGDATLDAGYAPEGIAQNTVAGSYRKALRAKQDRVTAAIEEAIGSKLDVKWNLTLAANLISADVRYGDINKIKAVAGVKDVILENRYEVPKTFPGTASPNTITAGGMIGSNTAWAAGYTGAGSKVAVIDTGVDDDHQSFAAAAFEYSLQQNAAAAGKSYEEYVASLNLLTAADVNAVKSQLNVSIDANQTYLSSKLPYAYNYIDKNYRTNHDNDSQGEHGSHVTGIAAANAYIADGGSFVKAEESVFVKGVAPDAQVLNMKVFGAKGGAYDADYMSAIEDAIILGADSVNLSLGSSAAGMTLSDGYQDVMDSLTSHGVVVCMSAGNSYDWPYADYALGEQSGPGYIYNDEVNLNTVGEPASFTNSVAVASVDNAGFVGYNIDFNGVKPAYSETSGYTNKTIGTLDTSADLSGTEYDYVYINGIGQDSDFNGINVKGKVVLVSRGETSFYEKHTAVQKAGGICCIVVNNQAGVINMDLTDSKATIPCVSITLADGMAIREASEDQGTYWTGKFTVNGTKAAITPETDFYTMSDFSSTGIPGSLTLKPEITAPGGNIYSVNGAVKGGKEYEMMSGTSMAAPQVNGMVAVLAQYVRENDLTTKTGMSQRQLITSLLMSTSEPLFEADSGSYYSVLKQGSGLGNVAKAMQATSFIKMDENATASYADGKIKAELGDDPERKGVYSFSFTINEMQEAAGSYSFRADFFTQDVFDYEGYTYLDTWTRPLSGNTVFTVNGETLGIDSKFDADVDKDGDTDADDAQAILDYVVGNIEAEKIDLAAADVDKDESITSLDAKLLLEGLVTEPAPVSKDGVTTVTVTFTLSDEEKAALDANYPNGAYIEGYVFAEPAATAEGVSGVAHSIPVIAFYGNWTDPSMYDCRTYAQTAYGEKKPSHLNQNNYNVTYLRYGSSTTNVSFSGNPYGIEKSFPADKLAVGNEVTFYGFRICMIRNAAAVAPVIVDLDNNKVIAVGTFSSIPYGAYHNETETGFTWQNTNTNLTFNKSVASLGLAEGTRIKAAVVAVPEYYGTSIDAAALTALIEEGKLGKGAYMGYDYTVDYTAPEALSATKDLLTGNLTITAKDNNNVAFIEVTDKNGSTVYGSAIPAEDADGIATATIDLSTKKVPSECGIRVSDYAGNSALYIIAYKEGVEDVSGSLYAYNFHASYRGGKGWYKLDADTLYWNSTSRYGGMEKDSATPVDVTAADYVDGYVFSAGSDGYFYVAPITDLGSMQKVGSFTGTTAKIVDMAFNATDKTLYALDGSNTIYTVDLVTGALTKQYTVTTTQTNNSYKALETLAIDPDGTFYAINIGGSRAGNSFVYKWTSDMAVDGAITALAPAGSSVQTVLIYSGSTTTWDNINNRLLLANNASSSASTLYNTNNFLVAVNPTTGAITKFGAASGQGSSYVSKTYVKTGGLFMIPGKTPIVTPSDTVTSVEVSPASVEVMKGDSAQLKAEVFPWSLENKAVTWSSSDESIVTVDANGTVTGKKGGSAVITATSVADPTKSGSATVKVNTIDWTLQGILQDAEGKPMLFKYNLATDDTWVKTYDVTDYGGNVVNAAYDATSGLIYSETESGALYSIDPKSGAAEYVTAGALGFAIDDIALTRMVHNADGTSQIFGVYGTYLLMEEDITSAFTGAAYDLTSLLSNGRYGYNFAALTWGAASGTSDVFYSITDGGYVFKFTYTASGSLSQARMSTNLTSVALSADYNNYYCSLCMGSDGKTLFYSVFTGESVDVYMLTQGSNSFTGQKICSLGDGVWPASLCIVTENCKHPTTERRDAVAATCTEPGVTGDLYCTACGELLEASKDVPALGHDMVAFEAVPATCTEAGKEAGEACSRCDYTTGGAELPVLGHAPYYLSNNDGTHYFTCNRCTVSELEDCDTDGTDGACSKCGYKAVSEESAAAVRAISANKTVDGTAAAITLTEDVDTTNGYITVSYDAAALTYVDCDCDVMFSVRNDAENGVIYFAYADIDGIAAGNAIATLNFVLAKDYVDTSVSVETGERNGDLAVNEEPAVEVITAEVGDHNYVLTDSKAATCTEKGYETYTCSKCGDTYTNEIDALGHDTELVEAVPATCTEDGKTAGLYCKRCEQIVSGCEVIRATGHTATVIPAVAATCTADGATAGVKCAVCQAVLVAPETVAKTGHKEVEIPAVAATCTEDGKTAGKYCAICDEILVEPKTVNKLGHDEIKVEAVPATCTTAGTSAYTVCGRCGAYITEPTVLPALEHAWDEGVVTTAPTCEGVGIRTFTCNRCEEVRIEAIEATGHTPIDVAAVDATCTESGNTAGQKCAVCGAILNGVELIPATGHTVILDEAVAPTCTEDGCTAGIHCLTCGEIIVASEPIAALGHDYVADEEDSKAPTCTEEGVNAVKCSRCGDVQIEPIAALGHDYVDGICSRCGEADPDAKDPCEGYTDIDRDAWYHDAADFVIARGLMGSTKTDALTFEPATACTRGMIVMILYNLEGNPDAEYEDKFPDVPDGQWYTKAVMWAYKNNIVSGYDNGKFGPNDKVTREQMAVVLKGYADFLGKDTTKTADLSVFPDGSKATWSKDYISWAVAEGLISGKAQDGKTYLDPQGVATRAEVAALIRGFVLNILEAK